MSTPSLPPDLRARVLAAAQAAPARARPTGSWRRAATVAVGMVLSVAVLARIGGPGPYGRPSAYYLALAALWLAVSAVAAWAGVSRGRSMLGRPIAWRAGVSVFTPIALIATAAIAGLAWPEARVVPAGMRGHVVCFVFTLLMALGPFVAFTFLWRGGDPVAPRLTGAAIGAAAGAIGALGIELRCNHIGLLHVGLAHVLPVAGLSLLGAWIAGRIVAVRTTPAIRR